MIDANTIENLQMIMNSGDGRQAALTELLQLEGQVRNAEDSALTADQSTHKQPPTAFSQRGPHRILTIDQINKDRPQRTGVIRPDNERIIEDTIAILDELSPADKEALLNLMDVLTHAFNNLFMTLVGHISIVMHHLDPSDPRCHLLRSSEDQIHDTAMMIRLMVDLFQRPQSKSQMLQLMNLGKHGITKHDFAEALKAQIQMMPGNLNPHEQEVLRIMMGWIAKLLQSIIHSLEHNLTKAFHIRRHQEYRHHFQQIQMQIKKGQIMCRALKDFAHKFGINRSALVSQLSFKYPPNNRHTPLNIECRNHHFPHPGPVNTKETVCIGNVCMSGERQAD